MKRLLLVAVMVLVSLVGMVGFSRAGNAVSALQATANPTTGAETVLLQPVNTGIQVKPKVYYLTVTGFTGGDAITACDSGLHMASISEIQDLSNLQYANMSIIAYDSLVDDQRLGPPSDHTGWVRTGSILLAGGPDYCDFSMSSFDQQTGTTLSLNTQVWGDSYMDPYPVDIEPGWHFKQIAYNRPQRVWCVEEPE